MLVEGLHAELARFFHDLLDFMHFTFEDQVRHQRRIQQDFNRRYASLAVALGQQPLRHNGAYIERQIHQQLVLALFGEEVNDAVERLVGAVRMQGCHAQVAGLGECNGVVHGLTITNLADQNDIGRLTQGVAQRGVPRIGIHAHFALRDDAVLVFMHEFNRVFDGDDVPVSVLIAVANHRGQRG